MSGYAVLIMGLAALVCSTGNAIDIESQWNDLLSKLSQGNATLDVDNFIDEMIFLVQKPNVSRQIEPFYLDSVRKCENCSINGLSSMVRSGPAQLSLVSPKTAHLRLAVFFPVLSGICYCQKGSWLWKSTVKESYKIYNVSASGVLAQNITPGTPLSVAEVNSDVPFGSSTEAQSSKQLLDKIQFKMWIQFIIRAALQGTNSQAVSKFLKVKQSS